MRSPMLRLAAGLLLLAACDGKKKSPTEYGAVVSPQAAPTVMSVATDSLTRVLLTPAG